MVTKLELITGVGDILTLTSKDNHDIFKAAQVCPLRMTSVCRSFKSLSHSLQVSVGLLGVISEVTFHCEPAFNLQETRYTLPLYMCLDNIDTIARSGQHVKYWVDLHTEKCIVYVANRTSESARDNPNHILQSIQVRNHRN